MAQHEEEIPSVKDLASSDPALRRRALSSISTHLTTRTTPLTPIQALQLQKGFFFALYMHDSRSPLSVQSLVATLAALTVSASTSPTTQSTPSQATAAAVGVALPLSEAFWSTMAREWTNIDAHRMDKYLLLVRMVVREVFAQVFLSAKPKPRAKGADTPPPSSESDEDVGVSRQIDLLASWPLSPRDRKVPDGLRYHVLDIYVDELERALTTTDDDEDDDDEDLSEGTQNATERLLAPVETIAKEGLSKGVRIRAKETLGDERVVKWRTNDGSVGGKSGGGNGEGGEGGGGAGEQQT